MIYLYNGILLSNEKQGTAETSNNVAGTPKYDVGGKKQTQKEHILYDSTYLKF